jgi:hypothetical protein
MSKVIFNIDKKIKEEAQRRAKKEGTTFSDVLRMSAYAYVSGELKPTVISTVSDLEQMDIESRYGKRPTNKSVRSVSLNI